MRRRLQAVDIAFTVLGLLTWGGRKQSDQKIEEGEGAWALNVAAILKIHATIKQKLA